MNRWLVRSEVIEPNGLNAHEEELVFASLKPLQGDRFLEQEADRVIGVVRRKAVEHSGSDALRVELASATNDRPRGGKRVSVDTGTQEKDKDGMVNWADTVGKVDQAAEVAGAEPLLVNEKTAAAMLGVSRRLVFDLNKKGVLPSKQIGSRKLYPVSQLRAFADGGGL